MNDVLMVVADEGTASLYSVDRGSGETTVIEELGNASREVDRRFADQIAQRIEEARAAGRAREIALVMPGPLLDLVRARLLASARNAIFAEVPHRRVGRPPRETLTEAMASRSRELSE